MIRLVKPAETYKDSYIASLLEDDEKNFPRAVVKRISENFTAFIREHTTIRTGEFKELDGNTYSIDPQYNYWLVNDEDFIGDICLRTELNPFMASFGGHVGYRVRPSLRRQGYGTRMLSALMKIAKEDHGMSTLIVMCSPENIGSKKIIINNRGKFKHTNTYRWSDAQMDEYRIDL